MNIAVLCATHRGYLVLRKLLEMLPHARFVVFSFREEPWEPPFMQDIREVTLAHGGQFFEGKRVDHEQFHRFWESVSVDLMLVVSWRNLIPQNIYRRSRFGTFVFHDSLLPRNRGFSPTVWAIVNGEDHTGVSLFEISGEVDAGDLVAQERLPIGPDDTIAAVMERVTNTYLKLVDQKLEQLMQGTWSRQPQEHARATYTRKRIPEDNRIDWRAPSRNIYNLIRAVGTPYSGAFTFLSGRKLRVWSAQRMEGAMERPPGKPGAITEAQTGIGSVVSTGDGALLLTRVQLEGADVVCGGEVLDHVGQTLGLQE